MPRDHISPRRIPFAARAVISGRAKTTRQGTRTGPSHRAKRCRRPPPVAPTAESTGACSSSEQLWREFSHLGVAGEASHLRSRPLRSAQATFRHLPGPRAPVSAFLRQMRERPQRMISTVLRAGQAGSRSRTIADQPPAPLLTGLPNSTVRTARTLPAADHDRWAPDPPRAILDAPPPRSLALARRLHQRVGRSGRYQPPDPTAPAINVPQRQRRPGGLTPGREHAQDSPAGTARTPLAHSQVHTHRFLTPSGANRASQPGSSVDPGLGGRPNPGLEGPIACVDD